MVARARAENGAPTDTGLNTLKYRVTQLEKALEGLVESLEGFRQIQEQIRRDMKTIIAHQKHIGWFMLAVVGSVLSGAIKVWFFS